MSEQTEPTEPIDPVESVEAPTRETETATPAAMVPGTTVPAATVPAAAPAARRTVTVPVLPLAIVGGIIVAVLFFGGGVAIGLGIGSHDGRDGRGGGIQQYRQGQTGDGFGSGNGFGGRNGQNGGNQNGGTRNGQDGTGTGPRPSDRPSGAPQQNG